MATVDSRNRCPDCNAVTLSYVELNIFRCPACDDLIKIAGERPLEQVIDDIGI